MFIVSISCVLIEVNVSMKTIYKILQFSQVSHGCTLPSFYRL